MARACARQVHQALRPVLVLAGGGVLDRGHLPVNLDVAEILRADAGGAAGGPLGAPAVVDTGEADRQAAELIHALQAVQHGTGAGTGERVGRGCDAGRLHPGRPRITGAVRAEAYVATLAVVVAEDDFRGLFGTGVEIATAQEDLGRGRSARCAAVELVRRTAADTELDAGLSRDGAVGVSDVQPRGLLTREDRAQRCRRQARNVCGQIILRQTLRLLQRMVESERDRRGEHDVDRRLGGEVQRRRIQVEQRRLDVREAEIGQLRCNRAVPGGARMGVERGRHAGHRGLRRRVAVGGCGGRDGQVADFRESQRSATGGTDAGDAVARAAIVFLDEDDVPGAVRHCSGIGSVSGAGHGDELRAALGAGVHIDRVADRVGRDARRGGVRRLLEEGQQRFVDGGGATDVQRRAPVRGDVESRR